MKNFLFLRYWPLFIIIISSSLFLTLNLERDPLYDWDECIYAQYAKEMKQTGDYLSYTWNGEKILEKPPLYGWLMQIPFIWSINEFTTRIISVISGLSLVFFIYLLSLRYFSFNIAILSSLLIFTSETIVNYLIKVNTDIGFSLFIFLGVYFWLSSYQKSKHSYLTGLMFGIATLFKGLSSIFFLFGLIAITILRKNKIITTNLIKTITLFIITISPWHIYQIIVNNEVFIKTYFWDHLVIRFFNNIFPAKNPFFYFVNLGRDFFPWWLFLIAAILIYFMMTKNKPLSLQKFINKKYSFFYDLIIIFAIPLLIFMTSRTQILWYLMPLYPIFVIIIALAIEFIFNQIKKPKIIYIVIFVISLDAFITIFNKTDFKRSDKKYSPSHEAFLNLKKTKYPEVNYLLGSFFRDLHQNPPSKNVLPFEFTYSDHPCIVYYSGKKVNLFYSIKNFKEVLMKKNGVYLINNEDKYIFNNTEMDANILYQNDQFQVIEN